MAQTSIAGLVAAAYFSKVSGAIYDSVPASTLSCATIPAIRNLLL